MTCNIYSFARPIFSRYTTFNPFDFFSMTAPSQYILKRSSGYLLYPFLIFFLSFYVSPSPYCIKFGKDFGDQLRNCNIFSLNGGSSKYFLPTFIRQNAAMKFIFKRENKVHLIYSSLLLYFIALKKTS